MNTDGGHPVAWLSFEEDKPGHVPDGQSVLVVQMSPAWSASRLEYPPQRLLPKVVTEVSALLPEIDRGPDWWDSQRWMLASPKSKVDVGVLSEGEPEG